MSASSTAPARSRRSAPAQLQLHTPQQAKALLQPLRVELLRMLAAPHSIGELAAALAAKPQRVHYHVKALEAAGLVRQVATRRVRALTEALYQAAAESFAPGPELLGLLGGGGGRDSLSKGYLLALAEELVGDAAQLAAATQPLPTMSLSAQVELGDPARRAEFLAEVQAALQDIAARYGGGSEGPLDGGAVYRLVLACYPRPAEPDGSQK